MKISNEMKTTFVFNVLLFLAGVFVNIPALVGAAVVIFVVLSCTVEILTALTLQPEVDIDLIDLARHAYEEETNGNIVVKVSDVHKWLAGELK
tara:strand:- start:386 stop:664 length:279 start_codon:yes stop_codon:yes gene_type:complete